MKAWKKGAIAGLLWGILGVYLIMSHSKFLDDLGLVGLVFMLPVFVSSCVIDYVFYRGNAPDAAIVQVLIGTIIAGPMLGSLLGALIEKKLKMWQKGAAIGLLWGVVSLLFFDELGITLALPATIGVIIVGMFTHPDAAIIGVLGAPVIGFLLGAMTGYAIACFRMSRKLGWCK